MDALLKNFSLERFDGQHPADLREAADQIEAGLPHGWDGEHPAELRAAALLIEAGIKATQLLGMRTVPQ